MQTGVNNRELSCGSFYVWEWVLYNRSSLAHHDTPAKLSPGDQGFPELAALVLERDGLEGH